MCVCVHIYICIHICTYMFHGQSVNKKDHWPWPSWVCSRDAETIQYMLSNTQYKLHWVDIVRDRNHMVISIEAKKKVFDNDSRFLYHNYGHGGGLVLLFNFSNIDMHIGINNLFYCCDKKPWQRQLMVRKDYFCPHC